MMHSFTNTMLLLLAKRRAAPTEAEKHAVEDEMAEVIRAAHARGRSETPVHDWKRDQACDRGEE